MQAALNRLKLDHCGLRLKSETTHYKVGEKK